MSWIAVLPVPGTPPADLVDVATEEPNAVPIPARVPITAAGVPVAVMTEASALAFAAAVAAFVAPLTPRLKSAQQGPFIFGFPV